MPNRLVRLLCGTHIKRGMEVMHKHLLVFAWGCEPPPSSSALRTEAACFCDAVHGLRDLGPWENTKVLDTFEKVDSLGGGALWPTSTASTPGCNVAPGTWH